MEITREKFVEISCTYLKFLFEEKEVIKKDIEDMIKKINQHTEDSYFDDLEYHYDKERGVCFYQKRRTK